MAKKSDLLKELGWSDDLIRHYMVEDMDAGDFGNDELIAEVHDTHSMTVTFNAENPAGSSFVVMSHAAKSESWVKESEK